jgi:hypothetical protein
MRIPPPRQRRCNSTSSDGMSVTRVTLLRCVCHIFSTVKFIYFCFTDHFCRSAGPASHACPHARPNAPTRPRQRQHTPTHSRTHTLTHSLARSRTHARLRTHILDAEQGSGVAASRQAAARRGHSTTHAHQRMDTHIRPPARSPARARTMHARSPMRAHFRC